MSRGKRMPRSPRQKFARRRSTPGEVKSEPGWKMGRKGVVIAGFAAGVSLLQLPVNYSTGGIAFVYRAELDRTYRHFEPPDSESMPDVHVLLLDIDRGPSSGLSPTDCVSSLSSIVRISCQSVRGPVSGPGLPIAITDARRPSLCGPRSFPDYLSNLSPRAGQPFPSLLPEDNPPPPTLADVPRFVTPRRRENGHRKVPRYPSSFDLGPSPFFTLFEISSRG